MASKGPKPVTPKTTKPAAKVAAKPSTTTVVSKSAAPVAAVSAPVKAALEPAVNAVVDAAKPIVETIVETIPAALKPAAIKKEVETMEATLKNAADKAQTYFADAQDRAKSAWEKGQRSFEDMTVFGKGNVEALVESGKIAAKGFETMGQDAADYGRKSFESASAALKSYASAKSPTELFKLHSDYVRSSFDSIVAETSKNTEAMLKLAGEIAQPISNRVSVAVEKVKTAA